MNIWEAKEEIKRTVLAYTAKTPAGTFRIPVKRQRPVLLIGPPGIGKTAIVEQIARECSLGLVAYTMTHHTRQSAVGLPVLEQKKFQGQEYTVTAYTMSEIIASVYGQMERTGRRTGILFLDEINCVSETLMPAMLQFLQYKTFGSHRLPEGWVIVAAGNPPAYNRSVREFDTVTLDRVKKMDVEPDLEVWKRYALRRGLHPAVLSFLELRPECFYVCEQGRKGFVTGRGWEDLSEMLLTMEELGLSVEDLLFGQYLQEREIARTFAFYYRLYEKWSGWFKQSDLSKLPRLPFDERLCITWIFLQRIYGIARECEEQRQLAKSLGYFIEGLKEGAALGEVSEEQIREQLERRKAGLQVRRDCGLLDSREEEREKQLEGQILTCIEQARLSGSGGMLVLDAQVREETKAAEQKKERLSHVMRDESLFIRQAFGEGRELVIFLTGLLEHPDTAQMTKDLLAGELQEISGLLQADQREEELRRQL